MASANLPEQIIGTPLFIPSANNFFSIDAGALPNGNDCLKILGATNRDYKAYHAAPTLTPRPTSSGRCTLAHVVHLQGWQHHTGRLG